MSLTTQGRRKHSTVFHWWRPVARETLIRSKIIYVCSHSTFFRTPYITCLITYKYNLCVCAENVYIHAPSKAYSITVYYSRIPKKSQILAMLLNLIQIKLVSWKRVIRATSFQKIVFTLSFWSLVLTVTINNIHVQTLTSTQHP